MNKYIYIFIYIYIYTIYMWKSEQSPAHLFRSDIVRSCYTLILDGKYVKYCIIIIMILIYNNLRIEMISSQCFGRLKLMQVYFLTRKIAHILFLWIVFPKCTKDLKTSTAYSGVVVCWGAIFVCYVVFVRGIIMHNFYLKAVRAL